MPLPRQIVVHGFLFNRGEKMSKSVGNVVSPAELVAAYGLDPVRYFFLREVPFGQDGNYSHEAIVNRMNADLANDIGNLAQRSLSMIARNCAAAVPDPLGAAPAPEDLAMLARADALLGEARRHMQSFLIHLYVGAVFDLVAETNRYFANAEPWKLAKTDPARMRLVLYVTIETLRVRRDPVAADHARRAWGSCSICSPSPRIARTFAALETGDGRGSPRSAASARGRQSAARPDADLSPLRRARGGAHVTLIDSHCHLDFPDFADELDAVVERALAAGVERMITIGTRVDRAARLVEIAERYDSVFFTVGTHPHEAAGEAASDFAAMRRFAEHPKCVGIGEAGLDYHYNYAPPRRRSARVSRPDCACARARPAGRRPYPRRGGRHGGDPERRDGAGARSAPLIHCFTSSRALAETALGLGFSISFSGVVTFKNSADLRAIAHDAPLDRILVETDAPYLAPVPSSGQAQRTGVRRRDGARRRRSERNRARGARRRDPRQHAADLPEARPQTALRLEPSADHSRLRLFGGRAPRRAGLGRV